MVEKTTVLVGGTGDQDEDIGVGVGLFNGIIDEARADSYHRRYHFCGGQPTILTDQILARALSKLFSRPRTVLDLDWFNLLDVGGCEIGICECWQLTHGRNTMTSRETPQIATPCKYLASYD